jgi:hypothetical protein
MNCGQALILSDGARNVATILLSDGARKVVGRAIDRTSRDCMSRAIDRPWHAFRLQVTCRFVPWIQFHRKRVDSKSHSSATVIQFSIQQFFKRTYALNKWAPLPMGNISADSDCERRRKIGNERRSDTKIRSTFKNLLLQYIPTLVLGFDHLGRCPEDRQITSAIIAVSPCRQAVASAPCRWGARDTP